MVLPKEYNNFLQDYSDDIFSLGITIFILITGHYPTLDPERNDVVLEYFKFMSLDTAYKKYPQYKTLLQGLFALEPRDRFTIKEALESYAKIVAASPENSSNSLKRLKNDERSRGRNECSI